MLDARVYGSCRKINGTNDVNESLVACAAYNHLISLSIPVNGPKTRSEQEDDSAED